MPSPPEDSLAYAVGGGQMVILHRDVLSVFDAHRQRRSRDAEAGGQLFADFSNGEVAIRVATEPRPTDRRSRFRFVADRKAEQQEIFKQHTLGYHYVGDWHTHPEDVPDPSEIDATTSSSIFRESTHRLNAILLIIVGRKPFPEGLYVGLTDGISLMSLVPRAST
ncbi:Mov34/MPN/PAD-1 family protein [Inquilinus sp. Marseille-Q2685]|uniref:Mov34/MPN/PAD-1 family protein n=1 Tax=Inquilinus sp. Marseille-Q2685 TaxID=2866581 RepID=UPI0035ABC2B4